MKKIVKRLSDSIIDKGTISRPSDESREANKSIDQPKLKSHPWRLCPIGEQWVRAHPLTVPASSRGPEWLTTRNGFCRATPSGKDMCTAEELKEIALSCFEQVRWDRDALPTPDPLGYLNGNKFDLSIAGWTKFWNEILNPADPITADFVKAFVASESSFETPPDTPSKAGVSRGLLQITESARVILQDHDGELKNYLVKMTEAESRDPDVSIAGGIRWLFHKRHLLQSRLKRNVTWEEAAAEYKGIFKDIGIDPTTDRIVRKLRADHEKLAELRKAKVLQ